MTTHVSILFHLPDITSCTGKQIEESIRSFADQQEIEAEIIALARKDSHPVPSRYADHIRVLIFEGENLARQVNRGIKEARSDFILYVDNRTHPVVLKQSCTELFHLTMVRHPQAGMVYADYELETGNEITDIRLLKHHIGRVRDNQDYGRVFFFRKTVLDRIGNLDESLRFNALYDLRLRISEKAGLVHISNKYRGALYRVIADRSETNVFDYLLAGKEVQSEAEAVITRHLKRIGAYLKPGYGYQRRPVTKTKPDLEASVIIPVNNRPEFIGTAIESVQAQSFTNIEVIIVVNGGKDDPTIQTVKQYQPGGNRYNPEKPDVRLLVVDINNIGFCLNYGVQHARGEYYIQLDSDDRLKPTAVEKILAVFNTDPTIGMVIGSYEVWEKLESGAIVRKEEIPVVTHDEWTEDNGRNNLLRINGAGAPRSIPIRLIQSLGYFGMNDDPYTENYGEDYDMVLRISEQYRIGRIYDPIYEVIRHSGGTDHSIDSATVNRNDEAKDWMRKEAIHRRRRMNRKTSA